MNNKSKVLLSILAILIVMSVGYALFSETISINGTATSSATFDLNYNCVFDDVGSSILPAGSTTCNYDSSTNTINATAEFKKPGDQAFFDINVTNNGSIPVYLSSLTSPNNYYLDENASEGPTLNAEQNNTIANIFFDKKTYLSANFDINTIQSVENLTLNIQSQTDFNKAIVIYPNQTLTFSIMLFWFPSVYVSVDGGAFYQKQPNLPNGEATLEYKIKLGFSQITSDMDGYTTTVVPSTSAQDVTS